MTNNSKRSLEYGAVASITLCCRAAIEGGAKPEECYDLSDVLLQQLEKNDFTGGNIGTFPSCYRDVCQTGTECPPLEPVLCDRTM